MIGVRRDVFQAIADPTRREIIHLLSQNSLNLNALSENFDVSRQAISLHIKILEECGLVSIRTQGRERYCQAKLDQLSEVSQWVDQYRQHWEKRLDALENYLDKLQKQRKNARRKK
jgi:DNA-binding transcriptional ArsR family regulator